MLKRLGISLQSVYIRIGTVGETEDNKIHLAIDLIDKAGFNNDESAKSKGYCAGIVLTCGPYLMDMKSLQSTVMLRSKPAAKLQVTYTKHCF